MSLLYFCGIVTAFNCLQMCFSRLRLMFEIRVCGSPVTVFKGIKINKYQGVFDIFLHALTNFSPLSSR